MIITTIISLIYLILMGKFEFAFYPLIRGIISYLSLALLIDHFNYKNKVTFFIGLILCFAFCLNIENIYINSQHAYIPTLGSMAFDTHFFKSSLSPRFVTILFFTLFSYMLSWKLKDKFQTYTSTKSAIIAFIFFSFSFLLIEKAETSRWVQLNPIEYNLKKIYYKRQFIQKISKKSESYKIIHPNESIITPESKTRNVILVFIEGLSQNAADKFDLQGLKKLRNEYYSSRNFISSQFQTIRSLYTAYCGRHPNFSILDLKPTVVSTRERLYRCLPDILRNEGYKNIFMQSASLEFYNKRDFLSAVNFDTILGSKNYNKYFYKTEWGIDDRSLYKYAIIKMLSEKKKSNDPIFMSLLTVSTHHPFPNYKEGKMNDIPAAFTYASDAVYEFIKNLEKEGLLKDTAVYIVADEPNPLLRGNINPLLNNSVEFIAITPNTPKLKKNDENFYTHSDLARTILDDLGIEASDIGGRNILKKYKKKRNIYFGNAHRGEFYNFNPEKKTLVSCRDFSKCQGYQFEDHYSEKIFTRQVSEKEIKDFSNFLAINESYYTEEKYNNVIYNITNKEYDSKEKVTLYEGHRIDASAQGCFIIKMNIENLTDKQISFMYNLNDMDQLFEGKLDPKSIEIDATSTLKETLKLDINSKSYILMDIFLKGPQSGKIRVNKLEIKRGCI